jgi:hypothetical protein
MRKCLSVLKLLSCNLFSLVQCLLVKFGSMIGVPVNKFWASNVTHVIAATDSDGACTRTLKYLMAILNGKWVLTIDCESALVFDLITYCLNLSFHL